MTKQPRSVIRPIRWTPEEYKLVCDKAKSADMQPSTFMREFLLWSFEREGYDWVSTMQDFLNQD